MKALYFDADTLRIALIKGLSLFWKQAALSPLSPVKYAEVPEPRIPGPNWVKVKNRMCGLCGTDVHFIFMDIDPKVAPAAVPPIPRKYLGHEMVGEVVEIGDGVSEFSPGDRVILRIDWPSCFQKEADPMCRQCARGDYLLCENHGAEGIPRDQGGGFSPTMVAHKTQLVRIEESIPDRDAILMEPTAVSVRSVLRRPPEEGEKVLVIGTGAIGLNLIGVIKAVSPGAEVYALSRYPHQAEIAMRLGASGVIGEKDVYRRVAEITGASYFSALFKNEMVIGGFDVIYDSVGSDKSLQDALRWARGRGTVVLVGVNFAPKKLDYSPVWFQEVDLLGVDSHGMEVFRGEQMSSFDVALTLYREGKLDFTGFVTHTFPMEDYQKAIETFYKKGEKKVVKIALVHS